MTSTNKLTRISPAELDGVLDEARAEHWTRLVLLGPRIRAGERPEEWPEEWKLTPRVIQLTTRADGLASKLQHLPGLTSLNLLGNSIGPEGAKAIAASLPNLTSLNLWGNSIGPEGAKAIAASLPNLTSLDLSGNGIGDEGAKAIAASLPNLTSLNFWGNSIGPEGAKAIAASLPNLTSLNFWGNSIGPEGAKAIAASLPNLTSLDLRNNRIGPEGAKAIAASLPNLTTLDLSDNGIGPEGGKAILDAWSVEARVGQLQNLYLRENGDLSGLLPKEALETPDAKSILAAYRSFRQAQKEKTLRPLNEVKLLVVGNETVGKTSLLRYLIDDKPRDTAEKKTEGVSQREKIEIKGWSPAKCPVKLNVWDFAGQEMTRGTHRFFLTARSLYLLVLEDRRQDDRSVDEWMKTIRNRGGESPVIIVINKSDNGKQDFKLDENRLRESYRNIAACLRNILRSRRMGGAKHRGAPAKDRRHHHGG